MTIGKKQVRRHDTHFTVVTCDTAGCGHGFQYQSPVDLDIEHTDEVLRHNLKTAGWTQVGSDDLCLACSNDPDTFTDSTGLTLRRVHYGNGISGWTARVAGPTKTTTAEEGRALLEGEPS